MPGVNLYIFGEFPGYLDISPIPPYTLYSIYLAGQIRMTDIIYSTSTYLQCWYRHNQCPSKTMSQQSGPAPSANTSIGTK